LFKDYEVIRQDIDAKVSPDYCCSVTDMSIIESDQFDGVFSCHTLEHLHPFDVLPALLEMKRVLNNTGFVYIKLPDLEKVAELILEGKVNSSVYNSEVGPITPLDIIFGYKNFTYNNSFYQHKCGFTLDSLLNAFKSAGFEQIVGRRVGFDLEAVATKSNLININEILSKI